jgi:hypothetical protein
MRTPIEVKEIGRSLLFIYSKDDCIEIGWTGAYPQKTARDGNVSKEEIQDAIEYFLNHPISNF